ILEGQRTEQYALDDAEDRRIGSDPQPEGQQRREGEPGRLAQLPQCEPDVCRQCFHRRNLACGCVGVKAEMEATTGFEPVNKGFADPRLTTWLRRPRDTEGRSRGLYRRFRLAGRRASGLLERETGFEPATPTL